MIRFTALLAVLGLLGACLAEANIPYQYPLFKQCDPAWANNTMGGTDPEYDTICVQGCAMSSVAMALNGKGYTLNGTDINPGTFNTWLQQNGGYTCIGGNCNNLVLDSPDQIDPMTIHFLSEKEKPTAALMRQWVDDGNPVMVAHVRNDSHFVLVTGYDASNSSVFHVHDPYYATPVYLYSDMSDLLSYIIVNTTAA